MNFRQKFELLTEWVFDHGKRISRAIDLAADALNGTDARGNPVLVVQSSG